MVDANLFSISNRPFFTGHVHRLIIGQTAAAVAVTSQPAISGTVADRKGRRFVRQVCGLYREFAGSRQENTGCPASPRQCL